MPDRLQRFVRDFTRGLAPEELRRLFGRDAPEAWDVLTRERRSEIARSGEKPAGVQLLFLGITDKLAPARRVLFVAALAFVPLAFLRVDPDILTFGWPVLSLGNQLASSTVWFLLSIATLLFLLALELVDRVQVRDELEVARELQSALLPSDVPVVEGYRIVHAYRTANEVGGDLYDCVPLADGRVALTVGDASGHGMAAGLLMAIANAAQKLALDLDPAPRSVLAMLNRVLYRTGDRRAFMSFFYALLSPASGRLRYSCAGHPFPMLRRADGEIVELGRGGFPLGVRQEIELAEDSVDLAEGDLLLLYSDGLPEALDGAGRSFGYDQVRQQLVAPGNAAAVLRRTEVALDRHLGHGALHDDLSLMVVERLSAVPPPPLPVLPAPQAVELPPPPS